MAPSARSPGNPASFCLVSLHPPGVATHVATSGCWDVHVVACANGGDSRPWTSDLLVSRAALLPIDETRELSILFAGAAGKVASSWEPGARRGVAGAGTCQQSATRREGKLPGPESGSRPEPSAPRPRGLRPARRALRGCIWGPSPGCGSPSPGCGWLSPLGLGASSGGPEWGGQ